MPVKTKSSHPYKILKFFLLFLITVLVFFAGRWSFNFSNKKNLNQKLSVPEKYENKYLAFLFEVYDLIQKNYWDKISDEQLTNIYVLGAEKLTNKKIEIKTKDKATLQKTLLNIISEIKEENKKNEFTSNLADIVLANLQPFGRSRLYSQKQEIDLQNLVENKNPEVDQYKVLEVDKNASPEAIKKTYETKAGQLKKENTPQALEKLAQIQKAYQVLSDEGNRKTYDKSGIEPTMESKLLDSDTFYIRLTKFSPTTIEELVRITQKVDKDPGPNTLIFDLRDNIGGAIDGLPYFLGPFIGNDQYAYQFFHQGEKEDFKTKIGWIPSLVRYKRVIVLINKGTQSTGEVMAATLKRFNVGMVLGEPTKGWGTVERVFPLNSQIDNKTKYSVFMVHRLTLREDGQPIEGKGVEPLINLNNNNWEKEFYLYTKDNRLIENIKKIWKSS